ncbi:unnamed protein product [Miscanthus lutarioriparius]|uniref:Uncharacterized protein n=1 Tax=Miscanthus lutarioriparius TaxID=422564 RepID=A0A811NFY8_9POAL|nr:unnamed protein product [Miscanthus lutarioriparius]
MEGRPTAPARVSMFRRLMVRVTPAERLVGDGKEREKDEKPAASGGAGAEADVGSVALDKMVISFMEESSAAVERPPRGRCSSCFNGNQDGSDDEDFDFLPSASAPAAAPAAAGDALELLKGLVQCASTAERNLLADASRIAERCGKGSGSGRKTADIRRAVADGLRALGYDAAVCTSRWDKTPPTRPASTSTSTLWWSPCPAPGLWWRWTSGRSSRWRGPPRRTARRCRRCRLCSWALPTGWAGSWPSWRRPRGRALRKRGLHFPPWRKHEYMRAKWLSPHARSSGNGSSPDKTPAPATALATPISAANFSGEFELRFDEKPKASAADIPGGEEDGADKKITVVVSPTPEEPGRLASWG